MAREYEGEVVFLGIAWKASRSECQAYIDHFEVPYDNALDEGEEVFRLFRVPYQPVTVLITADGGLFSRFAGPVGEDVLAAEIDAMVAA